jgi:protein-S-isoprenylcysteine O-methyltransferase Ste14
MAIPAGIADRKCEVVMKEPVDAAAVRIFPPAVPLLTILLGVALNRLCPFKLKLNLSSLSRYGIGGAIVGVAVLGLGLYPVILLRRTGQSENPWTPTTEIVTRGPFKFTRNPLYLQMVLGCIGFAIMLRNRWILLLTPVAAWGLQVLAILPEEAYLERKFGESYRSYQRRVRRWL